MEERKYSDGHVRAISEDVEETRTVEFVLSDTSKDRHGTVIPIDAWDIEHFNNNGIVGYQHNVYGGDLCNPPNPDDVIGTGKAYKEGDKIMASVTFEPADLNPLSEKVFRKILHGTLKAVSVGFIETETGAYGEEREAEGGPEETYYFGKVELVEFSIVNIPSNKNALKKSIRSQTYDALKYVYRELGGKYRLSDIEQMKVRDILDLMDGKEPEKKEKPVEPDLTEMKDRQAKMRKLKMKGHKG